MNGLATIEQMHISGVGSWSNMDQQKTLRQGNKDNGPQRSHAQVQEIHAKPRISMESLKDRRYVHKEIVLDGVCRWTKNSFLV